MTSLCVYDAGQLVSTTHVHGGMCGTKPCWKSTSKGYAFKDSSLAQDGAAKLDLVAGAPKPQLRFAGRGMNQTPSLPAAGQVGSSSVGTGPLCWGATYQGRSAETTVRDSPLDRTERDSLTRL
jgi:hypothetical protein